MSTTIGGTNNDALISVVMGTNHVTVLGTTSSTDIPVNNEYQTTLGGNNDAMLYVIDHKEGKSLIILIVSSNKNNNNNKATKSDYMTNQGFFLKKSLNGVDFVEKIKEKVFIT